MGFREKEMRDHGMLRWCSKYSYTGDTVGSFHAESESGSHLYLANSVMHDHAKHINMNDETCYDDEMARTLQPLDFNDQDCFAGSYGAHLFTERVIEMSWSSFAPVLRALIPLVVDMPVHRDAQILHPSASPSPHAILMRLSKR